MKTSSAIKAVTYNKGVIRIRFRSEKVYEYPCTPQEYATFHRVNSPGTYFNHTFAGRKFEQVLFEPPVQLVRSALVRALSRRFMAVTLDPNSPVG